MSKLLNTILLSTALVCCGNSYSLDTDGHYNILYDKVSDFGLNTFLFSNKCVVGNSENNQQLGQLYYKNSTRELVPLVDDENIPYFDLAAVVNNQKDSTISNYIKKGCWNLIIKTIDGVENLSNISTVYTLNKSLTLKGDNTTLIVPNGITLTKKDSRRKNIPLNILFKSGNNNTLLVLGNIEAMNDKGWWNVVDFGKYDVVGSSDGNTSTKTQSSIATPNAKIILADSAECSTECTEAEYGCSFAGSNISDTKIVMYPGVTLDHNIIGSNKSSSIAAYGNLYLNRFCNKNEKSKRAQLKAKVAKNVNVVYPTDVTEQDFKTIVASINGNISNLIYSDSFPSIYLVGKQLKDRLHSFEDAQAPLIPVMSEDEEKAVLGLDPSNDMAKYDVKLWDECKLNEGKYSFVKYYNKPENKGNYFNTDDAHKLFKDVNKSDNPDDDPLKLETNEVFFGLLGNRDVELVTEEDTVHFYGDNSEFKGTLYLPGNVKYKDYESEKSKIENIENIVEHVDDNETQQDNDNEHSQHNGDEHSQQNGDETSQQNSNETPTEHTWGEEHFNDYLNNFWDLAVDGTTVDMDLLRDNLTNSKLVLTDSGTPKTNEIQINGDNSQFKGIIVMTPDVKKVKFGDKSFVKTVNVARNPMTYTFFGNNNVTDFNNYSLLNNVDTINVDRNGTLTFEPGTRLNIG